VRPRPNLSRNKERPHLPAARPTHQNRYKSTEAQDDWEGRHITRAPEDLSLEGTPHTTPARKELSSGRNRTRGATNGEEEGSELFRPSV